jgi:hypothetical protein
MKNKTQKLNKTASIFKKKMEANLLKYDRVIEQQEFIELIRETAISSSIAAGIRMNEVDFNEILKVIAKPIEQLKAKYSDPGFRKKIEKKLKTEKAANLFVKKLREQITEDSIYDEEEFEALVFTTIIQTITLTDPVENIQPNDIFLYTEKRITELKLELIKKNVK